MQCGTATLLGYPAALPVPPRTRFSLISPSSAVLKGDSRSDFCVLKDRDAYLRRGVRALQNPSNRSSSREERPKVSYALLLDLQSMPFPLRHS